MEEHIARFFGTNLSNVACLDIAGHAVGTTRAVLLAGPCNMGCAEGRNPFAGFSVIDRG